MTTEWTMSTEVGPERLAATSEAEALSETRRALDEEARDISPVESTCWLCSTIMEDGEWAGEIVVQVDPSEPPCTESAHDWTEVPMSTWGHGGGVIFEERCSSCGTIRSTDTWAQDAMTGEQGLTSVRFERRGWCDD